MNFVFKNLFSLEYSTGGIAISILFKNTIIKKKNQLMNK